MLDEQTLITFMKKFEVLDLCGEMIIYDFETGSYNVLQGTAGIILGFVKDKSCVGEIADAITEIYDIEREQCFNDMSVFLSQLETNGFLALERV